MPPELSQYKPTWILLRGWVREQRHWGEFPAKLAAASNGQVICLDLPGTGTEFQRPSPRTIPRIVDDLRARYLQIPGQQAAVGSTYLVGISLGGMAAMDWKLRYPQDFSGLILINSSLASLSKPWHRLKLKNLPKILALALKKDRTEIEAGILELTTCLGTERREAIAKNWARFAMECPVSRSTLMRQLIAATCYRPQQFPTAPSLVLCSENDQLVDAACSRALAKKLGAGFQLHPEAGHDLPLDDPDWIVSRVIDWWRNTQNKVEHKVENRGLDPSLS